MEGICGEDAAARGFGVFGDDALVDSEFDGHWSLCADDVASWSHAI